MHLHVSMVEGQRDGKLSQNGKLGHSCARVMKSRLYETQVRDHVLHLGLNVSSSAHNCGCVVDGGNVMAAIGVSPLRKLLRIYIRVLISRNVRRCIDSYAFKAKGLSV